MIQPYEILSEALRNRHVKRLEVGQEKNKRSYPILVYFDNDEQTYNGNQKAVCYYNDQWCAPGYDKQFNQPLAGKPIPEVHQYDEGVPHYYSDIPPRTQHYSDNEPERGEEPGCYAPRPPFFFSLDCSLVTTSPLPHHSAYYPLLTSFLTIYKA